MSNTKTISVCSFESRRANEMRSLIEKLRGTPFVAPSMREIPLDENAEAIAFGDRLLAGEIDVLILMTGVGTRYLHQVVISKHSKDAFFQALREVTLVIRGPKPAAVLKEWKIPYDLAAPEPNTWRELLAEIEANLDISGKRVAVQEYGTSNPEFTNNLRELGATVETVTIYRWDLPEDREPLQQAVQKTIEGEFDLLLFTSAQQIRHVLQVAEEMDKGEEFRVAVASTKIASIGPTCTEALIECGFDVAYEASPPKMGHLVRGAIELARG